MSAQSYSQKSAQSDDGLRLYYRDYCGPMETGLAAQATPVICLHGLTRNSRDFEDFAPHVAATRRVLALDFRGRGFSDHDPDFSHYQPPVYAKDTLAVMQQAGIARAVIVGTSLGGIVGMILAQQKPAAIAGVVLNDIGPELDPAGLARIKTYTGKLPPVSNWQQAMEQTQQVYAAAWPDLDDAGWLRMARRSYRENAQGVPVLDMDLSIGRAIREIATQPGNTPDKSAGDMPAETPEDNNPADPWLLFGALAEVPTLLLRGQLSDLLAPSTVRKACAVKPDLKVTEVPNRGHVPLLDEAESLAAIDSFLALIP